jgi:hypothetical protein
MKMQAEGIFHYKFRFIENKTNHDQSNLRL